MSEIMKERQEFERNKFKEVERKYMPLFPDDLEHFLEIAEPVAQAYLSHPSEAFSLRVREVTKQNGEREYTATLKDRGEITDNGLCRLEVEIPINESLYHYYRYGMPTEYKHRAKPLPGVEIDFMHNQTLCEAEDARSWQQFTDMYGENFIDITDQCSASSEWRAHLGYRKRHGGQEALIPIEDLDASDIATSIIELLSSRASVVTRIAGRSGSGKSTLIREVEAELALSGVGSMTLSTDDYHRGKTWLEDYKGGEWTEWDAPVVYDVELLARDLQLLRRGHAIQKRWFDFATEEPAYGAMITSPRVILVEGIYAKSSQLDHVSDLVYEIPTPLATCVGRRLLRDMRERPQFADPEKSLRYILEQAEPAYRAQTNGSIEQNV